MKWLKMFRNLKGSSYKLCLHMFDILKFIDPKVRENWVRQDILAQLVSEKQT